MASAAEHAAHVLSAVLPARRDLLEAATRQLTPAHFPEKVQANIFTFLLRYSDTTAGAVMPKKFLEDQLRGRSNTGQSQLYLETYQTYIETFVSDDEFAWSVSQLRDIAAENATAEVLAESMEILTKGQTDQKTGETVRGHLEARTHLLERLSALDRDLQMQEAPEGDMRIERDEMLEDYAERKRERSLGLSTGIQFGIAALDRVVGGMQPGELVLTAGYSSDGKTTLCVQAAWHAAIVQKKNVVFLTTETLRAQVRRKLLARHSKLAAFNLPEGLNTRNLKAGTLEPAEEAKLRAVVDDLTSNPEYGKLYIAQVPRSASITSIEARLARIEREFRVDFVVMDYLALLHSERARQTSREELAGIMKESKLLATSFADSRGVPFMSPWQVTRAAREVAERMGAYSSASLSETAEATNSADLIVSLLAPTDNTNRYAEVTMQVLKNRDGQTANAIMADVDYATSWFQSKAEVGLTGGSGVSDGGAGFSGLLD